MESEQPPAESSDDPKPPSTTSTPLRSYECNFCKRGFTNAQALGGHMNIHRKDKVKFKHPSTSSNTLTPSNQVVNSPSPTRPRLSPTTTAISTSANPLSISHQGNWFSPPPQDAKQPLPLFGHGSNVPRNITQLEHDPSSPDREVDLELRLGHVDQQESESSSENKTTKRKFF